MAGEAVAGVNGTFSSEAPSSLLATPSPEREALLRQIEQESNLIILYLNVAELLPSAIIGYIGLFRSAICDIYIYI